MFNLVVSLFLIMMGHSARIVSLKAVTRTLTQVSVKEETDVQLMTRGVNWETREMAEGGGLNWEQKKMEGRKLE